MHTRGALITASPSVAASDSLTLKAMATGTQAISVVAAKEKVGLWAPVSIAQYSVYEALAAELMPSGCLSMSLDAPTVAVLNDKNKFSQWAAAKGLRVPKSFPVTSKQQLLEYNSR